MEASKLGQAGREGLKLLDQAAEGSDVDAIHRHRNVGEGLDQVIVHCVATAGESESAIADRRGAKHKLARMQRDAVLWDSDAAHPGRVAREWPSPRRRSGRPLPLFGRCRRLRVPCLRAGCARPRLR